MRHIVPERTPAGPVGDLPYHGFYRRPAELMEHMGRGLDKNQACEIGGVFVYVYSAVCVEQVKIGQRQKSECLLSSWLGGCLSSPYSDDRDDLRSISRGASFFAMIM